MQSHDSPGGKPPLPEEAIREDKELQAELGVNYTAVLASTTLHCIELGEHCSTCSNLQCRELGGSTLQCLYQTAVHITGRVEHCSEKNWESSTHCCSTLQGTAVKG